MMLSRSSVNSLVYLICFPDVSRKTASHDFDCLRFSQMLEIVATIIVLVYVDLNGYTTEIIGQCASSQRCP